MSFTITNDNYATYKKVYEILCRHIYKDLLKLLSPESDPLMILTSWEARSMSLAKKGLKAGLEDMLAVVNDVPEATIATINADLAREQLPSLAQIIGTMKDIVSKVLRTEKITTIHEYYIIKEILDDTASDISADNRTSLSKYSMAFEQKSSSAQL